MATSPAPDGRAFFYANPLHQRIPGVVQSPDFVSHRAASSLREPWFAVSCCPTNVARTLASLGAYLATSDDAGLQIHQYADSRISTTLANGRRVGVDVETKYPDDGRISIRVTETDGLPWTLTLRVPEWSTEAWLTDRGERSPVEPGTTSVEGQFAVGDSIHLDIGMTPRWVIPDSRVDSIRGCLAVERGALVLCVESVDLPDEASVDDIRIDPGSDLEVHKEKVIARGRLLEFEDRPWPYPETNDHALSGRDVEIPLTPYHHWANRGPSTMRVWIPAATIEADKQEER